MDLFVVPKRLPELYEIERLVQEIPEGGRTWVQGRVVHKGTEFPLHAFSFGPEDPKVPVFALFGGVHGLERIGTRVLISWLKTLFALMTWDATIHDILRRVRLVVLPLVNPVGMFLGSRANGNGVDLMRNAPVEAVGRPRFPLLGGHRISPRLPWFRGSQDRMEVESQALCSLVEDLVFPSKVGITLDIHSGFGAVDRLWFPYARSQEPFPDVAEVFALAELLDRTYPNHVYRIEPQSRTYTTHGDLWDHLHVTYKKRVSDGSLFIPLALELGSWLWVKKNPRQLLSPVGVFNPLIPHRYQRILRRHLTLIDFLLRVTASADNWAFLKPAERAELTERACKRWYEVKSG
jgi:hypothetical protein